MDVKMYTTKNMADLVTQHIPCCSVSQETRIMPIRSIEPIIRQHRHPLEPLSSSTDQRISLLDELVVAEMAKRKDEGNGDGSSGGVLPLVMKGAELAMDYTLRLIGPVLVTHHTKTTAFRP